MKMFNQGGFSSIIIILIFLVFSGASVAAYSYIYPQKTLPPSAGLSVYSQPTVTSTPASSLSSQPSPKPLQSVTPTGTLATSSNPLPTATPGQSNTSGQSTSASSSTPTSTPKPQVVVLPTTAPVNSGTITVDKTSVVVTLDRKDANSGLIYGPGFTITSQGATAWAVLPNGGVQGEGFYESSGGIIAGTSAAIRSYINPNKPNGTYTGSAIVRYTKNGQDYTGPTVNYSISLTGQTSVSYDGTLTVDKTDVNVTLKRSNQSSGFIYGSGFTITSQGADQWSIYNNESTQGQGFNEASGGISPGSSSAIHTYINTNKPNGTYTGSVTVKYQKNGTDGNGPTVSYTITLTD